MFTQRILIIGNETNDTDVRVTELAESAGTVNHGLITRDQQLFTDHGYYHTSVLDLTPGDIAHIADQFDSIVLLDQPKETYSHFRAFLTTLRLMYDLEFAGVNTVYRDNQASKSLIKWRELLQTNKSFCYYPFIGMVNNDDSTSICPKNLDRLAEINKITDWSTDPNYVPIRNSMLKGEKVSRCTDCYRREAEGQESTRQYETLEWAVRMGFENPEDFIVPAPLYHEVRPSNKCNIMCRMCDDARSHLIEQEWKTIGIPLVGATFAPTSFDLFNFPTIERVYYAGGEPTVMPEFFEFLQKCIDEGHTDFELNIGTNGMKFSNKLMNLLDHFSKVCMSISYDGYQRVNDYIRWGSDFDTVVKNSHLAISRGHVVSLQATFSMYNATNMHEVFEFYDREFPNSGALVQVAGGQGDIFLPYNHPCPELVVESMKRCQQTKVYYMNGRSVKSQIDLLVDHYSDPNYKVNVDLLQKFYEFNDKLDQSRNSRLGDYIPELEQARGLYFK